MACSRSALLERRPDLPLCSLRQMRQLRANKNRGFGFRELLTPKSLYKAERDVSRLLHTPVKISCLPQPQQIEIGKAIVNRLGKDDHWVTSGTAGWTFAAATREIPEEGARPVSVDRLRKVTRGVSREGGTSRLGSSAGERHAHSRKVQAEATHGLKGPRELVLLETRYRLAAAECRAGSTRGLSSDSSADLRYRRPRTSQGLQHTVSRSKDLEMRQNRDKEGVLSDYEEGGSAHAFGSAAATFLRAGEVSGNSEAVHKKGKKNSRIAGALRTSSSEGDIKTKVPKNRGVSSKRAAPSTPHPGLPTRTHTSPDAKTPSTQNKASGRRPGPTSTLDQEGSLAVVHGSKMTPQPLFQDDGAETGSGDNNAATGRCRTALHRGLVITEELREELINPMSDRFNLLRRPP